MRTPAFRVLFFTGSVLLSLIGYQFGVCYDESPWHPVIYDYYHIDLSGLGERNDQGVPTTYDHVHLGAGNKPHIPRDTIVDVINDLGVTLLAGLKLIVKVMEAMNLAKAPHCRPYFLETEEIYRKTKHAICLAIIPQDILLRNIYLYTGWSTFENLYRSLFSVLIRPLLGGNPLYSQIHNEHNENNIAISPYGAFSVLAALSEGLQGDSAHEILHAAHIPKDKHIIRVGLRDIHRHLKSYFIPEEGFLAGLTLNLNNVTLRNEYEDVLKFYGFDYGSFNNALYPEPPTTKRTSEFTTLETGLGVSEGTTIPPSIEVTTNLLTRLGNGTTKKPVADNTTETVITTTALPTIEGKEEETTSFKQQTTTTETTTSPDSTSTAQLKTTMHDFVETSVISSSTTEKTLTGPDSTSTEQLKTTLNDFVETSVISLATTEKTPTTIPGLPITPADEDLVITTLLNSILTQKGRTTFIPLATTTILLPTPIKVSEVTAEIISTAKEGTTEEMTKHVTEMSTVTVPTSSSQEPMTILPEFSTSTVEVETTSVVTTMKEPNTVRTTRQISESSEIPKTGIPSETTTILPPENVDIPITTAVAVEESTFLGSETTSSMSFLAENNTGNSISQDLELSTTPVSLLPQFETKITTEVGTISPMDASEQTHDVNDTEDGKFVTTPITLPPSFEFQTTSEEIETTTPFFFGATSDFQDIMNEAQNDFDFNYNYDANNVPPVYDENNVGANMMPTSPVAANFNNNLKRSARSVVDYVIARFHDDRNQYIGIPQRPQYVAQEPLTFAVYGKFRESGIHFMKYDTALPYFFVQNLNALALSFPLDSSKYYLLLLLPLRDDGVDQLICDLRLHGNLRYIINNLRLTHVVATIPSFMLKGYVTLTPTLQRLGVRRIFEPRQADFSPMTNVTDIYVTNIEQAVTVTIRNYLDSSAQRYKNFQQYPPVQFKADHPFLYFVVDSELHVALLVGKVINPLNSRIS